MAPGMEAPLYWNLLALFCLSVILVMVRMRQESFAREIDSLRRKAHSSKMECRNVTFMFYGLVAAWLIVLVYVVLLALRERKLRKELDRVRHMVEKR